MGLKETSNSLMKLLETCIHDLNKSAKGNKAAAQRVRTGTIKMAKIAKLYRKESVAEERKEMKKSSKKPKRKTKKK